METTSCHVRTAEENPGTYRFQNLGTKSDERCPGIVSRGWSRKYPRLVCLDQDEPGCNVSGRSRRCSTDCVTLRLKNSIWQELLVVHSLCPVNITLATRMG